MAEMTGEARVVALDRLRPGDIADCSGELLDVVFGWADFARLRRQVAAQCAAAGLTGTRLDDFVLAVHEIAANAIVHAGTGGRLVLRRVADGLRCMIADHEEPGAARVPRARRRDDLRAGRHRERLGDGGRQLFAAHGHQAPPCIPTRVRGSMKT